jgi:hypothetical protein
MRPVRVLAVAPGEVGTARQASGQAADAQDESQWQDPDGVVGSA